jgi:hypothetical protein
MMAAKAYDSKRSAEEKVRMETYKKDYHAIQTRNSALLHAKHSDSPYHKDLLDAETIEDQRNAAFAREIEQVCTTKLNDEARMSFCSAADLCQRFCAVCDSLSQQMAAQKEDAQPARSARQVAVGG